MTPSASLAQLTEVVSCLATFAAIALESSQGTARLERTVKERTARLQDALVAKSSFLSQMSHELRTPLFAVLGLAAVLEDSPGLDSVQQEHLATIRTSGEDLQTLISNVLDFSRLESGSLKASQLESIPYNLREVIENTVSRSRLFPPSPPPPPFSLSDLDPSVLIPARHRLDDRSA